RSIVNFPSLGEDLEMTVIVWIAGAVVGLIIAAISNWLVLPMVLRFQERQLRREPPLNLQIEYLARVPADRASTAPETNCDVTPRSACLSIRKCPRQSAP